MSYCPKCGTKVEESMAFCPRCGASLKVEAARPTPPPPQAPVYRGEKSEKEEKGEKQEKNEPEKGEKHEKGEFGFIGWIVAGLVLVFIGAMAYLSVTVQFNPATMWAVFLLILGVIIILVAIYIVTVARKRHPHA